MEQLFDSILLPHGVDVGDLVLGDGGEVQVDLQHELLIQLGFKGAPKNHVGRDRSPWPLVRLFPGNRFFLQHATETTVCLSF
jgi:hypothetical protein